MQHTGALLGAYWVFITLRAFIAIIILHVVLFFRRLFFNTDFLNFLTLKFLRHFFLIF